jgi:uncharacterized protein with PIN domain
MKHKFVKTEGCVAYDFTVDGESVADIPREKEYAIFDYLIERIREQFDNREIQLLDVVEMFDYDDYKYEKERCDQCGDSVSWTTWEI